MATEPAPVVRSPVDVLRLVVAVVATRLAVAIALIGGDSVVTFVEKLLRGLDALPGGLVAAIVVVTRLLTLAMLIGGLGVALVRGRYRMLLTIVAAGLVAAALAWL